MDQGHKLSAVGGFIVGVCLTLLAQSFINHLTVVVDPQQPAKRHPSA